MSSSVTVEIYAGPKLLNSQQVRREVEALVRHLESYAYMSVTACVYADERGVRGTLREHVERIVRRGEEVIKINLVDVPLQIAAPQPAQARPRPRPGIIWIRVCVDGTLRERLMCSYDPLDALRTIERFRGEAAWSYDHAAWMGASYDGTHGPETAHGGTLVRAVESFVAEHSASVFAPDLTCHFRTHVAAPLTGLLVRVDGVPHIVEACAPDTEAILERLERFVGRGACPISVEWAGGYASRVTDMSPLRTILDEYSRVQRLPRGGAPPDPLHVHMRAAAERDAWLEVGEDS